MQHYLGNPNLKARGVQIQFTIEQVKEFARCAVDPIYFIRNYVKVVHVDKGLVPFDLYPFQEEMVRLLHANRYVISKCPRQVGKSTVMVAYLLHYVIFNDNVSVAILANKERTARELLGRLQLAYEYLPMWMQRGVVTWNKGDIKLENGSTILASSTSSSAVRGGTYNIIFLDEFAFVPNTFAVQFFASVYPTVQSGKTTKTFIVSTPNGMNLFHKMWKEAEEKRSAYKAFSVHWSMVPGRDDAWRKETIANTSEEQFRQEFECEFVGSTDTLISPSKISSMVHKEPIESTKEMQVYEAPEDDRFYMLVADVGHGKGQDYSAFLVFDITETPYRIVCKYRNNRIRTISYPTVIQAVAKKYNNAFVLIEHNDAGKGVAEALFYDCEYENMITVNVTQKGQSIGSGFGKNMQLGVITSPQVKRIGCSNLKTLVESDRLIIDDYDTIVETSHFISKGRSYAAEEGKHDDLIMCCVLFSWVVTQQYFKDMTDQDVMAQLRAEYEKEVEDEIVSFILDDGLSETYDEHTVNKVQNLPDF